ncbi:MAG: peptidyl-tRNA hydrolase, family [Phycisphaerales bacterium]|jgi:PTH1 family peptidyl-tRNA hydrolase|nr:peptidyl-tRNA hydrolase, family [Phycisphaerales bacterium]
MKLVVGLGNPGREYVATRHNVGFEAVDRVAEKLGWISKGEFDRLAKSKFDGLAYDGVVSRADREPERLVLLKPTTFMNLSGKAVQAAMSFYQLTPADIMIVLDDLALPCGKLRIRPSGSDGGHNGLRDIQRVLGTNEYARLRLGVDAPPQFVPGRDYVLGRFTPDQRKQIDPALDRAAGAIVIWIDKGITTAMNQFNAETKV